MRILILLLIVIAISGAIALTMWTLISRAVNNAFDWFILTFGNDDAVSRLRKDRGWDP